jgi:hypothetical protein
MRGSPEGVRIDPVPDELDPKPRNDVPEDKAELEHDMDRRLVLREHKRHDLREIQDLAALAQTGAAASVANPLPHQSRPSA